MSKKKFLIFGIAFVLLLWIALATSNNLSALSVPPPMIAIAIFILAILFIRLIDLRTELKRGKISKSRVTLKHTVRIARDSVLLGGGYYFAITGNFFIVFSYISTLLALIYISELEYLNIKNMKKL